MVKKNSVFPEKKVTHGKMYFSPDKKFFPAKSQFYTLISKMNNNWYTSHSQTSFQNHELVEYVAYSDSLVYVHVTMEQKMLLNATKQYKIIKDNNQIEQKRIINHQQ